MSLPCATNVWDTADFRRQLQLRDHEHLPAKAAPIQHCARCGGGCDSQPASQWGKPPNERANNNQNPIGRKGGIPKRVLNEIEASNLSDTEVKVIIIRLPKELSENYKELSRNYISKKNKTEL